MTSAGQHDGTESNSLIAYSRGPERKATKASMTRLGTFKVTRIPVGLASYTSSRGDEDREVERVSLKQIRRPHILGERLIVAASMRSYGREENVSDYHQ